jgi:hypothetical protein
MNRPFNYHAIFTHCLQRPSRIPILAIDAHLCLFHPRADEARVPPKQRTGLSECRQSGGAFDQEFTQTPLAKHISSSGSLVAEVSSLCISSVCLITLDFPQPPRDSALRAVTKEVVGIHVLVTHPLFGGDILHRFLQRVSLAKSTSAPVRF